MKVISRRWAWAAMVVGGVATGAMGDPLIAGPADSSRGTSQIGAGGVNNSGLAIEERGVFVWSNAGVVYLESADPNGPVLNLGVHINDAGTIVGTSYVGSEQRAVRWSSPSATPVLLGGLTDPALYQNTSVSGLNASGEAVGGAGIYSSSGSYLGSRAVYWPANSVTPVTLGSLAAGNSGDDFATAVNDSGTIVGQSNGYAARWNAGVLGAAKLGTLGVASDGSYFAKAEAVNGDGAAAGFSEKYQTGTHTDQGDRPVRWEAGVSAATELDVPASALYNNYTDASAFAINAAGAVIGSTETYNSSGQDTGELALRWAGGGHAYTVLSPLGNFTTANASAINSNGIVVGSSEGLGADQFNYRATFWSATDGTAIDLNTHMPANSGWILERADAVSDTGFISGGGSFDPDGDGPMAAYERTYTLLVPQAGTYGQGDANFDGQTNFADLVILAQHYGQANAALSVNVADFDLNGVTNFGDLVALAQHYTGSGVGLQGIGSDAFQSDWLLAQSLVPEPALPLAIALAGISRPRTRRLSV